MSPAAASLAALVAAIALSCTSRINVGLIAVALAWALGAYTGRGADVVLARVPRVALRHARRGHAAVQPGGGERHDRSLCQPARQSRARQRARCPAAPLLHSRNRLDAWTRRDRKRRPCGASGHGDRRAHGRSSVPDGPDGRQRRECRQPVAAERYRRDCQHAAWPPPGSGGHEWKVFAANFLAHCWSRRRVPDARRPGQRGCRRRPTDRGRRGWTAPNAGRSWSCWHRAGSRRSCSLRAPIGLAAFSGSP